MSLIEDSKHLRIPFHDIKKATENFKTLIGSGGYGNVYRGHLSLSGKLIDVAVKRLQIDNVSGQGRKQFLTEIQMLSRYKHQNIISLVGFCEEGDERFLIYEYAEHGSLDNYLQQNKNTCPLTWKQRISICVDVARGLDHLHNHVAQNKRIIHRDIKSGNILLDHNLKAMIADFGLSKLGRANETVTYLITDVSGTPGYVDPAYMDSGMLTKEADVYSFGVVLFEVLCGSVCYNKVPLVRRYYKEENLDRIIDDDLKEYTKLNSMKVFSDIAFKCLEDDRKQRPSMDLVLKQLEKALKYLEHEEELGLEEALAQEMEEASDLLNSSMGVAVPVESGPLNGSDVPASRCLVVQESQEAPELLSDRKLKKQGDFKYFWKCCK